MTRTMTAAMQTAVQSAESTTAWLIELQFAGSTTRLTTAPEDLDALSLTWEAVGGLIKAPQGITESTDLKAQGVELELSGVDQALVSKLLTDKYIGRSATIYLAHIGTDGQVVQDPVPVFEGEMNDGFTIEPQRGVENTTRIRGRIVSKLARLSIRAGIQTNVASHQEAFDGDLFFEFVPGLMGKNVTMTKWQPDQLVPWLPPFQPEVGYGI